LKLNFNGSVIEFFTAAQLRLKAKEFLILAVLLCPFAAVRPRRNGQAENQPLLKQNTVTTRFLTAGFTDYADFLEKRRFDPAPAQEYLFWCGIDKETQPVENKGDRIL